MVQFLFFQVLLQHLVISRRHVTELGRQSVDSDNLVHVANCHEVTLSGVEHDLCCFSLLVRNPIDVLHFNRLDWFLLRVDKIIDVQCSHVGNTSKDGGSEQRPFDAVQVLTKAWFKVSNRALVLHIIKPNASIGWTGQEQPLVERRTRRAEDRSVMLVVLHACSSSQLGVDDLERWLRGEDSVGVDLARCWLHHHVGIDNVFHLLGHLQVRNVG